MRLRAAAIGLAALAALGCYKQQMGEEGRMRPLQRSELFDNRMAARPLIPGTVARGQLRNDELLYRGTIGAEPATVYPFPITAEVLRRGSDRYDIFCSPCHDRVGGGNGIVVQRGFRRPTSLHVERLRQAPPGYLFDAMTNGFGAMSSYASQVPVRDRWAIVAYVRALQLAQAADVDELPQVDRDALGVRR